MNISELLRLQKEFDKEHFSSSGKCFYQEIDEDRLPELEHLLVCVMGELGEFSNIVKKVIRGDFELDSAQADLNGELADVFIYLLKISNQFGIDIEKEIIKKIELNRERFSKYKAY